MSEDWDEHAENWDRDEHVRTYADQAFASLKKYVNVCDKSWKSKRVLDFGCGTGLLTEKLSAHVKEVVAVDTSKKMIAALERKQLGNVIVVNADIGDPSVRHGAAWLSGFDLITASSVCSFLPDYEFTVGVLSGALSSDGYIVQWDWETSNDDGFGLTKGRIESALEGANLKRIRVEQAFSIQTDEQNMPVLIAIGSSG